MAKEFEIKPTTTSTNNNDDTILVLCKRCNNHFQKSTLEKDCGNCFVCLSCEAYICPNCGRSIIVQPILKSKK